MNNTTKKMTVRTTVELSVEVQIELEVDSDCTLEDEKELVLRDIYTVLDGNDEWNDWVEACPYDIKVMQVADKSIPFASEVSLSEEDED